MTNRRYEEESSGPITIPDKYLFVNNVNEKVYILHQFVSVKSNKGIWATAISYRPHDSNQIFVRYPSDFFAKFIPKAQWDSATEQQRKKLKRAPK